VLTVAGCVLAGLALLLAGRWRLRRFDALGRRRPFPTVSVVLCCALALGCAVPVVRHARLERRLQAAAVAVTGDDVSVHCQTAGEASVDLGAELGYVKFGADGVPEPRAVLKWGPCRQLSGWLRSDRRDAAEVARLGEDRLIAVHVLTHEAVHTAGVTDEAATECRAMQLDAATAQALGATPDYARAFARRYWREIYPRMPDAYRSGDCRPGGPLDQHRPDAPWGEDVKVSPHGGQR
jgi:hypothetical protein